MNLIFFSAVAGAIATVCHDAAMNPVDGKLKLLAKFENIWLIVDKIILP